MKISGISDDGARWLPSFFNHKSKCSIEAFFFARYPLTLKFPKWPCIIENNGFYYPFELLYVFPPELLNKYDNLIKKKF